MSLVITNNVASLTAQNNLTRSSSALGKSLEHLSSGLKINRGADGPAALVISEQQRAQIFGLETAIENTSKGVNLVQTGEGALNEINSLLTKARSLALDSANSAVQDANSSAANQAEIDNILNTISNIAERTQFGTKKLLNGAAQSGGLTTNSPGVATSGTLTTPAVQSSFTYSVTIAAARAQGVASGGFAGTGNTLGSGNGGAVVINGTSITLTTSDTIDSTVLKVNNSLSAAGVKVKAANVGGQLTLTATDFQTDISLTGSTGATLTGLGLGSGPFNHTNAVLAYTNSSNATVTVTGNGNVLDLTGELSGIRVTLGASSTLGSLQSVAPTNSSFNVGSDLVFQIGANSGQTASLQIGRIASDSIGVGASTTFATLSAIKVDTANNAQESINVIDQAIKDVSNLRGKLGAFQSQTLESTANNLRATLENTVAAESTIRDTDFAKETATFTKNQILLQVGTNILTQSNNTAQLVLGLLPR